MVHSQSGGGCFIRAEVGGDRSVRVELGQDLSRFSMTGETRLLPLGSDLLVGIRSLTGVLSGANLAGETQRGVHSS